MGLVDYSGRPHTLKMSSWKSPAPSIGRSWTHGYQNYIAVDFIYISARPHSTAIPSPHIYAKINSISAH